MDIASYVQVYPHPEAIVSGVLFADISRFAYNLLGTLCCVGLFIMVMAAIIFAAVLYRRRRSTQILAMRALLQQQSLSPTNEEDAILPTDESLQSYGAIGANPNTNTHVNNQDGTASSDTDTASASSDNDV